MANEKIVTSIRIPTGLSKRMAARVVADDYSMRARSLWIEEAILRFLEISGYEDHVKWDLSGEVDDNIKTISLTLNRLTMVKLDNAIIDVRKQFPEMEGVKSGIIRAAIIQRILQ